MSKPAKSKTEILREAGFAYTIDLQMYINLKTKKAFSAAFVQDHSQNQIRKCIQEHSSGPEWRFYFNAEPSEAVKHELELALG
ncbi:hypothetical protein [Nevskia soli]|jgi:hypothetical protein|uniref:hypothetical protein n=1 Tax=Nevskia soli TaxID=418856 RepID=UPI0015D72512|nr:hypothetical protein [Nevskia soli]